MMESESIIGWSEETSRSFVDTGEVYTPRRGEMLATFLDLIPAEPHEVFIGVELATGAGWLINGILVRFPNARMIGLDGSPAMLDATRAPLGSNADRAELKLFRLEEPTWPDQLPDGLRCIVSSLAVHHLDHEGKRRLYRRLFEKLEPGGGLLILDLVEATSEPAQTKIDELTTAGATETDQAKRTETYKQIQALLHEEVPCIFLWWTAQFPVVKPNIGWDRMPIHAASCSA